MLHKIIKRLFTCLLFPLCLTAMNTGVSAERQALVGQWFASAKITDTGGARMSGSKELQLQWSFDRKKPGVATGRIPAGEIKHWRVNKFSAQTKKIDFTLEPKGRHPFRVTGQFNDDFTQITGDFQMPIGHGAKMAGPITLKKHDTWPTNPTMLGAWTGELSARPENRAVDLVFSATPPEKKKKKTALSRKAKLQLEDADFDNPEWQITTITGLDWDADRQRWLARLSGKIGDKPASIHLELTWDEDEKT